MAHSRIFDKGLPAHVLHWYPLICLFILQHPLFLKTQGPGFNTPLFPLQTICPGAAGTIMLSPYTSYLNPHCLIHLGEAFLSSSNVKVLSHLLLIRKNNRLYFCHCWCYGWGNKMLIPLGFFLSNSFVTKYSGDKFLEIYHTA